MYVVFDALAGAIYTYDAKLNTFGTRCPLAEVKPPPESPTPSTPPAPPEPPAPPVDSDPVAAAAAASATAAAASATAAAASAAAAAVSATAAAASATAASVSVPVQGIAGNSKSGVAYFNNKQVFYRTDIDNSKAEWKRLPDAPFPITGMCGDLSNGIVIQNGDMLAQMTDVFNSPVWQSTAVSPRIPIKGIAGDGSNGIVVFRDRAADLVGFDGGDKKFIPNVYTFTGKPYSAAQSTQEPPIFIDLLAGDGSNGYIAFGENQLFSLDAKGAWTKISSLKFGLNAIVGNAKDGLLALIGAENFLVSFDLKTWTLQNALPTLPKLPTDTTPATKPNQ